MAKSKWVGGRIDNFLVIEGPTMFTKLFFALPLLNVNVAVLNGPPKVVHHYRFVNAPYLLFSSSVFI
jgi:hypothetical protein